LAYTNFNVSFFLLMLQDVDVVNVY